MLPPDFRPTQHHLHGDFFNPIIPDEMSMSVITANSRFGGHIVTVSGIQQPGYILLTNAPSITA